MRALLPRLLARSPDLQVALFVKTTRDVPLLEEYVASEIPEGDRIVVRPIAEMMACDADVFWYPWNVARPAPPHGAVVVTMHDVAPIALPDPRWRAWWKNLRWRRLYAATARRATIVVADSAFTASEVQRTLDFPMSRIRVALLAADDFCDATAGNSSEVLDRLGIRKPFVLTVGAADRRKNYAVLDRAMRRVVSENPMVSLVLAGPRRHLDASDPLTPWKRTLGFVSDADLVALYREASTLVMPSTYEGFGLPVLEAMRMGTPVICARAASLPEVAGDAADWVDPADDAQLASAISRVLSDPQHRAAMSVASRSQAAHFSWDLTARATLEAFDDARRLWAAPDTEVSIAPECAPVGSGV